MKDKLYDVNRQLDDLIIIVDGNDCEEESREAGYLHNTFHDALET